LLFGAGLAAPDVHRLERGANDAAGLGWRAFMMVFGPFCPLDFRFENFMSHIKRETFCTIDVEDGIIGLERNFAALHAFIFVGEK
jgi:hypothetical protein